MEKPKSQLSLLSFEENTTPHSFVHRPSPPTKKSLMGKASTRQAKKEDKMMLLNAVLDVAARLVHKHCSLWQLQRKLNSMFSPAYAMFLTCRNPRTAFSNTPRENKKPMPESSDPSFLDADNAAHPTLWNGKVCLEWELEFETMFVHAYQLFTSSIHYFWEKATHIIELYWTTSDAVTISNKLTYVSLLLTIAISV